jgi:hypothetical protein
MSVPLLRKRICKIKILIIMMNPEKDLSQKQLFLVKRQLIKIDLIAKEHLKCPTKKQSDSYGVKILYLFTIIPVKFKVNYSKLVCLILNKMMLPKIINIKMNWMKMAIVLKTT